LKLKLYIKQTDTFNTSGIQIYYHGANPSSLNLYTGQLPSARQWPNYGSYIDVTEDAGDLYRLKLTWTSERDKNGSVVPGTIQQKKSASGTLKFEGEAYKYMKRWLIDDVSAPLNSVDVKIEHEGCGTYYGYTINCTDLQWCEGSTCTFDVTLKQKDEILNCIRSTAIADNWMHRFEDGAGISVKHPRFNYCNEIRPNGSLVVQWFNMAVTTMMLLTLLIPLIGIYNTVIVPTVNSILFILRKIESALNSIPGVNVSFDIRPDLKLMDPEDIKDAIAQMFLEAAGCGRMHPAPLIRSYIDNVCEKCGVKVDAETAPIFYAEKMLVHASDDSLEWKDNPHYNACYLNAPVKRGIRRYRNLGIGVLLGYSELNMDDYYLQDNRPLHTLDTFLEELKLLYNAEWKLKTITKNGVTEPYLFFQRKDFFVENKGGYIFDFGTGAADRNKLIDGVCYEWSEKKTPAFVEGIYNSDAADGCGNEARSQMNGYASFGDVVANPTFDGKMDKIAPFGATKFRLDGASTDYIFDALQVMLNSQLLTGFMLGFTKDIIYPPIRDYADYALLLRDETCTLPKVLIWDPSSGVDNAMCVRPKYAHHDFGAEPDINSRYNTSITGVPLPWSDLLKHKPNTFVIGSSLTFSGHPVGRYLVQDIFHIKVADRPAMLVNYPMYFEPGYKDTLWDWFHWIDDPKRKPVLNQNWSLKMDLCCDDLKKLQVFDDASAIVLSEKVKLPIPYYGEGVITEIEVSYDPTDNLGQYIQLKGTV
jgi:hypothetical protein